MTSYINAISFLYNFIDSLLIYSLEHFMMDVIDQSVMLYLAFVIFQIDNMTTCAAWTETWRPLKLLLAKYAYIIYQLYGQL